MMKLLLPSLFMTTVISVTPSKFVWLAGVVFLALATFMMLMNNVIFFDLEYMGYSVSYSSLSYYLVILSVWISLVMILSSFKIMKMNEFSSLFSFLIMFLMLVLLFTFTTNSSLLFYFFFEASLIPTLIIIMGWGYQPERLQAGLYFLFYTLTASLPLLLTILFLSVKFNSMVFYLWGVNFLSLINMGNLNMFLILGLALAFLVKLPMFFTHLWLPKAHVEAPVAGSMILAGVLLKLGGYGLMCVAPVLILFSSSVNGYMIGLSLAGMLFVGFICLRLNDFKALVAYSSVAHMGMVISGILSFYIWGFNGGVVMMLAHGLSSSGLFSIVNMYYERLGSRSFFINKGLLLVFPLLSLFMFLLTSANMAAPPTMNLMSEIFLMGSIMGFDLWMLLLFPLGSFMGAVFSLFMFSFSQHGKLYNMLYSVNYNDSREFHILFLHIMPVNFLILNSVLFMMVS